jgi:hypothetical protein
MHLNFYGFSDEAVHVAGFAVFILIISSVWFYFYLTDKCTKYLLLTFLSPYFTSTCFDALASSSGCLFVYQSFNIRCCAVCWLDKSRIDKNVRYTQFQHPQFVLFLNPCRCVAFCDLSFLFFFSVGLPVANAQDVLQPCGLLYYPWYSNSHHQLSYERSWRSEVKLNLIIFRRSNFRH